MKSPHFPLALLTLTLLAMAAAAPAAAGKHVSRKAHPAKPDSAMAAEAKITMDQARATALAKVPGGTIRSSELERENNNLIYSFDIRVPGKSGIQEVIVDAMDGSVISATHESPRAEKKEARLEKAEAARDASKVGKATPKH